jgi:iron-sulfur cluster repair protein YtfE (RIC family)
MIVPDPMSSLGDTHGKLNRLTFEIGRLLRATPSAAGPDFVIHTRLVALLEELRGELLDHFANEEEGLFPFIRQYVPAKSDVVDRMYDAHDSICGMIVRLAHLASRGFVSLDTAQTLFDRFQKAYGAHSLEEADLLTELGQQLSDRQRSELGALLRGLA